MLCHNFPSCTELTSRRLCSSCVDQFAHSLGLAAPSLFVRTWIPAPSFDVALAKIRGGGTQGLTAEQVALL